MEMRLQKALAQAGVASRRHAEELIEAGRVEVNSEIVRTLGTKVDPEKDLIRVDGKLLKSAEEKVYLVLFKPVGVVTTLSDPQGRQTVRDLLTGVSERVFAVGRLDYDAEGALIVTNDGELANHLMHPRYGVPRTYLAKVKGEPDEATLELLRSGVRLEDGVAKPDRAEIHTRAERNTWLELVVSEGRPHLVKRLCAAIGHPVVRLFRPRYAGVGVEGMAPGTWRELQPIEIETLKRVARGEPVPPGAPLKLPPRQHRAAEDSEARPSAFRPAHQSAPRSQASRPHGRSMSGGAFRGGSEGSGRGDRRGGSEGSGRADRRGGPQGLGRGDYRGAPERSGRGDRNGGPEGSSRGDRRGRPDDAGRGDRRGGAKGSSRGDYRGAPQGSGRGAPRGGPRGRPSGRRR